MISARGDTFNFSPLIIPDGFPIGPIYPLRRNSAGQIVAYHKAGIEGTPFSFVFDHGVLSTLLLPPGGPDSAGQTSGINDNGQIVGQFDFPAHGYLYSNGSFTFIDVPGRHATFATCINDKESIVGYTPTSTAVYGINNLGEMVGSFVDGSGTHAFELN